MEFEIKDSSIWRTRASSVGRLSDASSRCSGKYEIVDATIWRTRASSLARPNDVLFNDSDKYDVVDATIWRTRASSVGPTSSGSEKTFEVTNATLWCSRATSAADNRNTTLRRRSASGDAASSMFEIPDDSIWRTRASSLGQPQLGQGKLELTDASIWRSRASSVVTERPESKMSFVSELIERRPPDSILKDASNFQAESQADARQMKIPDEQPAYNPLIAHMRVPTPRRRTALTRPSFVPTLAARRITMAPFFHRNSSISDMMTTLTVSTDKLTDSTPIDEASTPLDASTPINASTPRRRSSRLPVPTTPARASPGLIVMSPDTQVASPNSSFGTPRQPTRASTSRLTFTSPGTPFGSPAPKHIVLAAPAASKQRSPYIRVQPPKIVIGTDEFVDDHPQLRRSKRTRLTRVCNRGLGERPIYKRDENGDFRLVGVQEGRTAIPLCKKHGVLDLGQALDMEKDQKKRRKNARTQNRQKWAHDFGDNND